MKTQGQLPLQEVMPLLDPIYDPVIYSQISQLKQCIVDRTFNSETNTLAEKVLLVDTSNYNAWYCKKMFILSGAASADHEYSFANSCLGQKAKSFQVWQQKRFLFEKHPQDGRKQLKNCEEIMNRTDHKNYHAWSYRVWLVKLIENYQQELAFASSMIDADCFNNSAWSYRFFLIQQMFDNKQGGEELKRKEVEYVLRKIKISITNKASWNYLRGLFPSIRIKGISSKNSLRPSIIENYTDFPEVLKLCMELWAELLGLEGGSPEQEVGKKLAERELLCTLVHIHSHREQDRQFALDTCQQLAEKDKQKAFYWLWVKNNL